MPLIPTLALVALPITDPVLIFALAMVVFLIVPLLFERMRVPGIIGLILAGTVLGPNGFNVLERGSTIVLLGTVGLLFLMFMVGLELDLNEFNRHRRPSAIFGFLSFLLPQLIGTGLMTALGYPLRSAILMGAIFASHTVLAYPIASRLQIIKNQAVTTTLGGTILTEILALLVLAVIAGSTGGGIGPRFFLVLGALLAGYVVAVLWGVPRLGTFFFRRVRNDAVTDFVFVMAVVFTVAYLANAARVEPIIGALLAGLALNRLIPHQGPLMGRINFMGNALFIPFFLLSVGMLVDVRALTTVRAWLFSGAIAIAVIAGKWLASKATERIFGYTREEGWTVFGLSVPHASGTLAIVLVGFDIGVFDQAEVNGVVLTILVTSLVGPWAVEKYGRLVALQEEQRPYEASDAPRRILIPISNPKTSEALMGLAFMLRGQNSDEPLYPLTVVRDVGEMGAAQVAEAEKMLSSAVIYAASVDAPVVPLTRVDNNYASGIARGIAETRTTTVVIGWDGRRTRRYEIFGSVLDQLLEQTKQLVLVAKLGHPLATTKRLVVVLPPGIKHHPGFYGAVHTVKTLASELGANVLALVLDGDPARYEKLMGVVRPRVSVSYEAVSGWERLMAEMRARLRADDVVVVFSARRGTIGWHRELERLPGALAQLVPESFLVLYPAEVDIGVRTRARGLLPRALAPERIIFDLPKVPFEQALKTLLQTRLGNDAARLEQVVAALHAGGRTIFTEIHPGVMVLHARLAELSEPVIFLATSPEGIAVPQAAHPARLMFLLLSPLEHPERHLVSLAEIAHLVGTPERMEEILASHTLEDLLATLEGEAVSGSEDEAQSAPSSEPERAP